MKPRPEIGVILAAGRGQRMQLFSDHRPKPVMPVANRPLIARQLEMLESLGVRRTIVVIGHLGAEIVKTVDHLEKDFASMEIDFHDQGELLGIAHAVGQLEEKIDGPFYLFLGDIFFVPTELDLLADKFAAEEEVKAVLSVRDHAGAASLQKNFAVYLDEADYVSRVVEKPHHARTDLKGCGLYLFDLEIFDAIRRTHRTALRDEYELTDSIQILIDDGYKVRAAENLKYDINLTFPEDILRANLAHLEMSGMSECVDPNAQVEGAVIERSIIGSGAFIAPGSRLEACLIMPGTRIGRPVEWKGVIASGEIVVQCNAEWPE